MSYEQGHDFERLRNDALADATHTKPPDESVIAFANETADRLSGVVARAFSRVCTDPDETGFTVVPARYDVGGREKIDLIRDSMSDEEFAAYCRGTALKYDGRGKGDADPEKRRWYLEMASHVAHGTPDPRSARPSFEGYSRASMPERVELRRIDVLDHGFVRLVETWGQGDARIPEAGIVEAARQSTQGAFRGWKADKRLLDYLMENKHSTPFEFAGMVLEIKAPIFVFREWHRHRTQSYSEMSARYSPVPEENYLPTWQEVLRRGNASGTNKQAGAVKGAELLTEQKAKRFVVSLKNNYAAFAMEYQCALEMGVPKELARLGMPVGRYSQMRAQANLRNWLGFLTLRLDPAAQWEIRQYAEAVHTILVEQFPRTLSMFTHPAQNQETP